MRINYIILGLAMLVLGLVGCSSNSDDMSNGEQEVASDLHSQAADEETETEASVSVNENQGEEESEENISGDKDGEPGVVPMEEESKEAEQEAEEEMEAEEAVAGDEDQKDAAFLSPTSTEYDIEKIEKAGEWIEISAEYPVFGMGDMDQLIAREAESFFEKFEAEFAENEEINAQTSQEGEERLYFWEPVVTDEYVSFMFIDFRFLGGPHPHTSQHPFNYDVNNNRKLTIQDFVKNESQLSNLSDLIYEKLPSEHLEEDMLEEVLKPEWDNFNHFILTEDSIVFHYEHYVLGPYAYGVFEAEVTFDELNEL
ncbi:RsiV family protein [Oceanobacillus sp. CFH 90083]|uniref:RsiV family protein n=1 Tax=Oceanobacillus sp. CFH 90083 TaxID=2592336 RepID=UPI0018834BDD|nr:RsiV family protein [Oceanobacillus sp. CFH 90083]